MGDIGDTKLRLEHRHSPRSIVLTKVYWVPWGCGWLRQRRILFRLRYWWGS